MSAPEKADLDLARQVTLVVTGRPGAWSLTGSWFGVLIETPEPVTDAALARHLRMMGVTPDPDAL